MDLASSLASRQSINSAKVRRGTKTPLLQYPVNACGKLPRAASFGAASVSRQGCAVALNLIWKTYNLTEIPGECIVEESSRCQHLQTLLTPRIHNPEVSEPLRTRTKHPTPRPIHRHYSQSSSLSSLPTSLLSSFGLPVARLVPPDTIS